MSTEQSRLGKTRAVSVTPGSRHTRRCCRSSRMKPEQERGARVSIWFKGETEWAFSRPVRRCCAPEKSVRAHGRS